MVMSESRTHEPELDPKLEDWLRQARAEDEDAAPPDLDAMFGAVRRDIDQAEKRPSFWLRTRPTWMRRAIAGGAAALVVGLAGALALRGDFADYPTPTMAAALLALGSLLVLALHQALRPLHRPPISPWARAGLVALTLGSTFTVALLSPPEEPTGSLVSPCLFYGLLMGVPVYFVLRLLDRSAGTTSPLLAACAAGLAANLVLQLHCPVDGVEHLMANHFSVALLFVAALWVAHLAARRLRRR